MKSFISNKGRINILKWLFFVRTRVGCFPLSFNDVVFVNITK